MKKILSIFLAVVITAGMLTGCQKGPEAETTAGTEVTETTAPEVTEPVVTEPVIEVITHGKMIRKLYKLANPSGDYEDLESAIAWAVKNGVVTDDAPFDPEAALTNLDMARFLYRYAKALDVVRDSDKQETLTGWVWDEAEITEEADREAVAWAIGSGVMKLYQRQLLPDEAVTASEYRAIPAKLSSLVKAVKEEQQAALEPEETEPEETEPEETDSEEEGNGGGANAGSQVGTSGNSGSTGNNQSRGGSSSSGSGSSGGGTGVNPGGATEPPVTEPKEPPTYDKEAAKAAGNNYLAGLGCTIDPSVAGGAYNFPGFWSREWLANNGGQAELNQRAIDAAACDIDDIIIRCSGQDGIDYKPSDFCMYCDVVDYTDYDGRVGYLIYIYYG